MGKLKEMNMTTVLRKISELNANEYNPRILTEIQYSDLQKSLKKFGIVDPIIININPDRKDVIIGGHQRIRVWEANGREVCSMRGAKPEH